MGQINVKTKRSTAGHCTHHLMELPLGSGMLPLRPRETDSSTFYSCILLYGKEGTNVIEQSGHLILFIQSSPQPSGIY